MKIIRVLHVFRALELGGAESMIMNIYKNIDTTKIQFDFIVHYKVDSEYTREIEKLGGKIYLVNDFKGYNIIEYINSWHNFFKKHRNYSIIHGHMGSTASIYLNIAKKYGLYTIAHSHSVKRNKSIKDILFNFISYRTKYVADYFFACSSDAAISRYGRNILHKNNYKLLKNGIDFNRFFFNESARNNFRKTMGIDNDTIVVGHVGNFKKVKNHVFLIKTFSLFLESHPNSILILVGTGELEDEIKQNCIKLRIREKVVFLGSRKDVELIMQGMDIFLFPSLSEGLGIVLIEAQSLGLKCLVSKNIPDEACITPIIQKCLSDDEKDWVNIMNTMLHTQVNRETFNRSKLEEKGYNVVNVAQYLDDFYNKICKKRGEYYEHTLF